MKKILDFIGKIILFLLLVILIFNVVIIFKTRLNKDKVPGVFGYKPLVVLSGSMRSSIDVGDLIVVKETDVSELKENDIIAYKNGKHVIAHRIVKVYKKKMCFKTKGDSNNVADDTLVCKKDIVGKYQFKIPKVGNFIIFMQEPLGFGIIMISILFIGTLIYIVENNKLNKKLLEEKEESIRNLQNKR